MEDDLNFFENRRRPQKFLKWKTTSIFWKLEDNLKFQWEIEDNSSLKEADLYFQMEDN